MANPQLRTVAEDLEQVLASIKPKPVVRPPTKAEARDATGVARALFEYVLHKAPEDASYETLGEALAVGIRAASIELGLEEKALFGAIDTYVCSALRAAAASIEESE